MAPWKTSDWIVPVWVDPDPVALAKLIGEEVTGAPATGVNRALNWAASRGQLR